VIPSPSGQVNGIVGKMPRGVGDEASDILFGMLRLKLCLLFPYLDTLDNMRSGHLLPDRGLVTRNSLVAREHVRSVAIHMEPANEPAQPGIFWERFTERVSPIPFEPRG
jgi:hypothetical protein